MEIKEKNRELIAQIGFLQNRVKYTYMYATIYTIIISHLSIDWWAGDGESKDYKTTWQKSTWSKKNCKDIYICVFLQLTCSIFPNIPIKSKVYQKQSTALQSHMVNTTAVQPLLRILQEDTRALRAKLLSLRNTTAKGFKNHRLSLDQVRS